MSAPPNKPKKRKLELDLLDASNDKGRVAVVRVRSACLLLAIIRLFWLRSKVSIIPLYHSIATSLQQQWKNPIETHVS